jgi:hypothetical protein
MGAMLKAAGADQKVSAMHHGVKVITLFVVGLAVALGTCPLVHAQESTPVVTQGSMGPGITFLQIPFGTVDVLPPAPASITIYQLTIQPGASFTSPADSGLGAQVVSSGTLTLRGFTADVVIHRADGRQEVVPANVEAALGAGDAFVWEPDVAGEIGNDGTEPVIVYSVNIVPVTATPEAERTAPTQAP